MEQETQENSKFITVTSFCKKVNMAPIMFYSAVKEHGYPKHFIFNKRKMYLEKDLREWLENMKK